MRITECFWTGPALQQHSVILTRVGTAGRKLGQEAVQLHGGMGVTDEMDVAHYFKRLTTIDTLFGNADYQLERFQELELTAAHELAARVARLV